MRISWYREITDGPSHRLSTLGLAAVGGDLCRVSLHAPGPGAGGDGTRIQAEEGGYSAGISQPETRLDRLCLRPWTQGCQLSSKENTGLCPGAVTLTSHCVPQDRLLVCLLFPSPHLLSQPLDSGWSAVEAT